MGLETISAKEHQEMSMVDLAFEILKSEKQPLPFQDIADQVKEMKELQEEEIEERIARFYTNLNLDGRFIFVGENHWGLRSWYPFDQKEEDIEVPKRKRKRQDEDEDEYDDEALEDEEDEEDDDFEEDVEDYEEYDEDDYGEDIEEEEEREDLDEEEDYR